MKQTVKIIGGLYRGKTITFPDLPGLRPTPNRVRETLFNWLMHDLCESRCLDAFAGSGALGIEAYSRGAKEVTFLEQSQEACLALRKNLAGLNSPNLILHQTDSLQWLACTQKQFNIIFLDPPFKTDLLFQALDCISKNRTLAPGGLVYIESHDDPSLDTMVWEEVKLKKAGEVYYGLYSLKSVNIIL